MTTAVAAPGVRRLTRDDVARLGQAGRPWEFVPVGYQVVGLAPEDWGMRVLLAANLARLGLRGLAAEQLAALPESVCKDGAVAGLARVVAGLADDRIARAELEETVRANVEALLTRGMDLRGELARWRGAEWEWFRAADGNVVRRRGPQWLGLSDQRRAAADFAREHLSKPDAKVAMFTVEGADPPWLLMEIAARSQRARDGYWPRLLVVQADAMEFLDGLAHADLRPILRQERTAVFVGPLAPARLLEDLRGRLGTQVQGAYIPQLAVRTRATPPVPRVLEQAEAEQAAEHERLVGEVRTLYAGRDRAWWGRRFERSGEERLRVLVPSCRYTTFVKHAGADLVEAMKRLGHEAELLIEEDDASRFSTLAYLRAIARFKPDLIVLVNYTRRQIGEWLPPELPFVTWIQDAMPHLFDAEVGKRLTAFDFVVGHVFQELWRRFGYPRERTRQSPVVASATKFHAGPSDSALLREHRCEIALVSHHSEPPERMHERLVDEAGRGAPIQRVLEELRPRVVELASDPVRGPVYGALEAASREALERHLGARPDERMLSMIHKSYCLPLADRVLRHQTLGWAAELAEERGWTLHVYGRGWERHPRFGAYARGELAHGEELRAAYRGAVVHLHVSINTLAHQRVMECALSGGLPLCRLVHDVMSPWRLAATRAAILRGEPTVGDPATRRHGHFAADHPECAAFVGMLQRCGQEAGAFWWVEDHLLAGLRRDPAAYEENDSDPSPRLVGDFGETTFTTKARLAELVARAIESPGWRSGWSGLIAVRVRERFTHERFAEGVIGLVRSSFGDAPRSGAER